MNLTVHLLDHYCPKVAVSTLVNSLKGVSHGDCAKTVPILPVATGVVDCGQPVTFAAVRRCSIEVLRQYIEQQRAPE